MLSDVQFLKPLTMPPRLSFPWEWASYRKTERKEALLSYPIIFVLQGALQHQDVPLGLTERSFVFVVPPSDVREVPAQLVSLLVEFWDLAPTSNLDVVHVVLRSVERHVDSEKFCFNNLGQLGAFGSEGLTLVSNQPSYYLDKQEFLSRVGTSIVYFGFDIYFQQRYF